MFVAFIKQSGEENIAILIYFTTTVGGNGLEIVFLAICVLFPIFLVTIAVI